MSAVDTLIGISAYESEISRDIIIGPWRIYYNPPPIPTRNCDWHCVHEDYDGSEDGPTDPRHASRATPADCIAEIVQIYENALDDAHAAILRKKMNSA